MFLKAAALALLLSAPALAGGPTDTGAGAVVTVGSGGYRRFGAYGDAAWDLKSAEPYVWGDFGVDTEANRFSFGGGVWALAREGWRAKGGVGVTVGRYRDTDEGTSSVTLETGAERKMKDLTAGGEYRLTSGGIARTSAPRATDRRARGRNRGRGDELDPESFRLHELSGYARLPAGETSVGLRVTLAVPSYSGAVLSETASWTIPFGDAAARLAATLEQGPNSGVYGSAGLDYRVLDVKTSIEKPILRVMFLIKHLFLSI